MGETSTEKNARPGATAGIAAGWQRFEEPLWKTLVRNVSIAAAVGAVLALSRGRLSSVALFTLLCAVVHLWRALCRGAVSQCCSRSIAEEAKHAGDRAARTL